MKRIVTLTFNPAIDAAAEAEVVRPIRKIRTWGERYGAADIVALTLGRDGALLGTRAGLCGLDGLKVKPRSAVGAGDSFLAAMTLGLAQGRDPEDAFALAVAAGTAAVMIAGTELCRRADVERLYCTIKERASRVAFERL